LPTIRSELEVDEDRTRLAKRFCRKMIVRESLVQSDLRVGQQPILTEVRMLENQRRKRGSLS
jgi:hypothetical protein